MITTLFPARPITDWRAEVERLSGGIRRRPFDDGAVDFVSMVAARLMASPVAREHPELASLAHWFRPASIETMRRRLEAGDEAGLPAARGLVFALAPANVHVLFIYGWFLSLLAGNSTIVRVSQKPSPVRDAFLALVGSLAREERFWEVLSDSWLVSYPHDAETTRAISLACDARLIWGGDATVREIRSIDLKPTAVEGAFADRFSLAAFDARAVAALNDTSLSDIARRFANDCLWFDQQACSSPRGVYWVGSDAEVASARERFWPAFEQASRGFENEPAAVMSRLGDLFVMAAHGIIEHTDSRPGALPTRAWTHGPMSLVKSMHSGFGLFVESRIASLADIGRTLDSKDQTLVAFGFDEAALVGLSQVLPNRALDRIVLPGQATDFSIVWDGTNLFDLLTRRIVVGQRRRARRAQG